MVPISNMPNVVSLYGTVTLDNDNHSFRKQTFGIVMEKATHGDCLDYFEKVNNCNYCFILFIFF